MKRFFISAEMGGGKTPMAIEVAKRIDAKQILVVAPAVVRHGWLRELDTWWPGHPEAAAISLGAGREKGLSKPALERKLRAYSAPIQIVSYDLVESVATTGWDFIVLDEAHRLKNPLGKQTKAVKALTRMNPRAGILGLSGTPMADKPIDIWSPFDIIWPDRFGQINKNGRGCFTFNMRYSNRELRSWGGPNPGSAYHFFGINEEHVEELRMRLAAVSSRLTKRDLAAFLPPLTTQKILVPRASGDFKMHGASEDALVSTLLRVGEEKIGPAVEWLEDATAASRKLVVFTYGIELAEKIAKRASALRDGPEVVLITGKVPADKRQALVDHFKAIDRAVCVASMKSVGIGINGLDCATDVLFAELYYRPETLEQALGRFNRLSSTEPTTISLLILEGTIDEALAVKLEAKVAAINAAIKASTAGEALSASLGAEDPAAEVRFLEELAKYSETALDEDAYLT